MKIKKLLCYFLSISSFVPLTNVFANVQETCTGPANSTATSWECCNPAITTCGSNTIGFSTYGNNTDIKSYQTLSFDIACNPGSGSGISSADMVISGINYDVSSSLVGCTVPPFPTISNTAAVPCTNYDITTHKAGIVTVSCRAK